MTTARASRLPDRWLAAAVLAGAAAFWLLIAAGVANPLVISDEYAYWLGGVLLDRPGALAVLQPALNRYDSPLFLRLLSALGGLGPAQTIALKLFNVALVAIGWRLALSLAERREAQPPWALLAAVCLYPTASYAGYLLPEALYGALFLVLVVVLTHCGPDVRPRPILGAAALAGLLSLTKQHGLFVCLGLVSALACWFGPFSARFLKLATGSLLAYGAVVVLGGIAIAPLSHAAPFVGGYYHQLISQGLPRGLSPAPLWPLTMSIAALAMLVGPFLVVVTWRAAAELRQSAERTGEGFAAVFLLCWLTLVLVCSSVILAGEPDRVHLRFVNFACPAFLALAWRWRSCAEAPAVRRVAALVGLLGAVVYLATWTRHRPLPIDSPELFFSYGNGQLGEFGLRGLALPFTALVFLAVPFLVLGCRTSWLKVSTAALVAVSLVSAWNLAHWHSSWSRLFAPSRSLGKIAGALCGPREGDVRALGLTDRFTDLYQPLAALRRPAPMAIVRADEATQAFEAVPAGVCILTTAVPPPRFVRLAETSGLALYRAR